MHNSQICLSRRNQIICLMFLINNSKFVIYKTICIIGAKYF